MTSKLPFHKKSNLEEENKLQVHSGR